VHESQRIATFIKRVSIIYHTKVRHKQDQMYFKTVVLDPGVFLP
jgi:hypothetical protein